MWSKSELNIPVRFPASLRGSLERSSYQSWTRPSFSFLITSLWASWSRSSGDVFSFIQHRSVKKILHRIIDRRLWSVTVFNGIPATTQQYNGHFSFLINFLTDCLLSALSLVLFVSNTFIQRCILLLYLID